MGLKSKVSRAMHKAFDTPEGFTTAPPKKWAEYGINQPMQPVARPRYHRYEQHDKGYEVPVSAADSVSQRGEADNEHYHSEYRLPHEQLRAHEKATAPSLRAMHPAKRSSPPPAYRSRQGSAQPLHTSESGFAHSAARVASNTGRHSTSAMSETTSCRPLTFCAPSVAGSSSEASSQYDDHVPLVPRKTSVSSYAGSSRAASSVHITSSARSMHSTDSRRSRAMTSRAQTQYVRQTSPLLVLEPATSACKPRSNAAKKMSSCSVDARSIRASSTATRSQDSNSASRASATTASHQRSGSTAVPKSRSRSQTQTGAQSQPPSGTPNMRFGLTTSPNGNIQFMFSLGNMSSQFDTPSQPPQESSPAMSAVGDLVTECGNDEELEDDEAPLLSQHGKIMSWSRDVPSGHSVVSATPSRANSMLQAPSVRPPPSMSRQMVAPQVDLPILTQAQRTALSRAPSHVSRGSRADGVKTMLYHMSK